MGTLLWSVLEVETRRRMEIPLLSLDMETRMRMDTRGDTGDTRAGEAVIWVSISRAFHQKIFSNMVPVLGSGLVRYGPPAPVI